MKKYEELLKSNPEEAADYLVLYTRVFELIKQYESEESAQFCMENRKVKSKEELTELLKLWVWMDTERCIHGEGDTV